MSLRNAKTSALCACLLAASSFGQTRPGGGGRSGARGSDVSPEAVAVVHRMLEATGGAFRWAAMKTRVMKAHLETEKGVLYQVTTWLKGPAYRRDVLMEGKLTTPIATDGVSGWSLEGTAGLTDLSPSRLEAAAESRDKELPFVNVAVKGFKLEASGLETVDGRELIKLTLTLRNGAIRIGLFDPKTGLLDREILKTRSRDGIESVIDQRYSDFKTVAGYKVPFRIARFAPDGKLNETLVVDEVRFDESIEDAWFKKPAASVPPLAPRATLAQPEHHFSTGRVASFQ